MRLQIYPAAMVDQLWDGNADALVAAMPRNHGECTGDQLKMMLMRGDVALVGSADVWAAVQFVDYPNMRALHIYAVASRGNGGGINHGDIAELAEYARANGATAITCSADKAAERLYSRYGFDPVYTTLRIAL